MTAAAGPAPAPDPSPDRNPDRNPDRSRDRTDWTLLRLALVGAAVAVGLGAFGRVHRPTGIAVDLAGFSGPMEVKVALATLAGALAVIQLVSALAMYGRLPGLGRLTGNPWLSAAHRWSGRLAFVAAVPVAIHCLYALGLQTFDLRVLAHSLLGCAFFGVFTTKMLALTRRGLPGWTRPPARPDSPSTPSDHTVRRNSWNRSLPAPVDAPC